jgi:hypothetical protein
MAKGLLSTIRTARRSIHRRIGEPWFGGHEEPGVERDRRRRREKATLYVKDTLRSDARQFATEAIAQNDNTVPDGLVGGERRYAERCKDKGVFG